MNIVHDAQNYLSSLNIDQWQDGYPDEEAILSDIANGESYVVEHNGIAATVMLTIRPEITYNAIEGEWITDLDATYGVIHRMAVAEHHRGKGIARFILNECERNLSDRGIPSMRIDTHEDNLGMQKLLRSSGYTYCGVIYLTNGDKRLAFENILD